MADARARPPPPSPQDTSTLLLRRLPATDLNAILALVVLCGLPTEGLDRAVADGALFALLDVGAAADEAVAAALLGPVTAQQSVELVALAVTPAQRRLGLGTRLLREVVNLLRSEGLRRVTVGGAAAMVAARLYERAGFSPVPDSSGNGFELEL